MRAKQNELFDTVAAIKDHVEKVVSSEDLVAIEERIQALEKTFSMDNKKQDVQPEESESGTTEVAAVLGGLSAEEEKIVRIITSNGLTENRIKKELCDELSEDRIDKCLEILVNKGLVSTVKRGRHTIFIKNEEDKATGGEKSA
jgi:hypothetical protein